MENQAPSGPDQFLSTQEKFLLGALALVAFLTRIFGIWEWSVLGDEFYTIAYAAERMRGVMQPAYYALVVGSFSIFEPSAWAARLPSAFFGAASVPLFFWGFRNLIGKKGAFIGSVLVIFHSWHLYHSHLSRFYAVVFFFAILSYALYFAALQKDSYKLMIGALVANVVGTLFHATAILVPAACAAFSLYAWFSKTTENNGYSKRIARTHTIIFAVMGLLTAPFFFFVAQTWGMHAISLKSFEELIGVYLQFVLRAEPILIVSALLGLYILFKQDFNKAIFFSVAIVVPLIGLIAAAIVLPPVRAKYVMSILPLFIGLSAYLCAVVADKISPVTGKFAQHALAAVIIVALLPSFVSTYSGRYSLDIKHALRAIEEVYQPGDKLVVFSNSMANHLMQHFPNEYIDEYSSKAKWKQGLLKYENSEDRVWVLIDTYRNQSFNSGLHAWITEHATLKWRKYEKRYDYPMRGLEVFLIDKSR